MDLFADRTSCHRFLASQSRLLFSSTAYLLVQALRRAALAGTELAEALVGTIRLRFLKVAARVLISARRVVFHLASSCMYRGAFRVAYERVIGHLPTPGCGRGLSRMRRLSRKRILLGAGGSRAWCGWRDAPAIVMGMANADE